MVVKRGDASADEVPTVVQSFERGLAVIRAFDAEHPSLTLSEVARATSLTRAAARRFLLTLVENGYAGTDGRFFWLRPAILELGYAYLSSMSIADVAQPHLAQLSQMLQESSSISVLDGDDVVYVARAAVKQVLTVSIHVGSRFPAYATSMGRVLLAALPPEERYAYLDRVNLVARTPKAVTDQTQLAKLLDNVARRGFALVDEELEVGLRALAVPIQGPDSTVVAAMNVSMPAGRRSARETMTEVLPALQFTVERLEHDLRVGRLGGLH